MSFASEVKEEQARLDVSDDWKKGRLCAYLQLCASLAMSSKGINLSIKGTNNTVIRTVAQDLNNLYDIRCGLNVLKDERFNRRYSYEIIVDNKAMDILKDLDLYTEKGLQEHPRMSFLKNEERIRGYIGGCFMANGSVNSPLSSNYHLELTANSEKHGEFVIRLMSKFGLNGKMTTRKSHYIVYMKMAQQIADFLAIIGVNEKLFEFEEVRIDRDMYNSIQRIDNIEGVNDIKSLTTARKQEAACRFIKEKGYFPLLGKKEQEIVELRLEFVDASLNELCDEYLRKTAVSLSKSGIRHRFEKIMDLAQRHNFVWEEE